MARESGSAITHGAKKPRMAYARASPQSEIPVATILNKTHLALRVPLPGKKILRLGPHLSGEVSAKAVQHPPLQAMVTSGEIEITEEGKGRRGVESGNKGPSATTRHGAGPEIRRTGKR